MSEGRLLKEEVEVHSGRGGKKDVSGGTSKKEDLFDEADLDDDNVGVANDTYFMPGTFCFFLYKLPFICRGCSIVAMTWV